MCNPIPTLLTPEEAATLLGVSTRSLIRYAQQGRLTRWRTVGGHGRYLADEIHKIRGGA